MSFKLSTTTSEHFLKNDTKINARSYKKARTTQAVITTRNQPSDAATKAHNKDNKSLAGLEANTAAGDSKNAQDGDRDRLW
ncbi:uncharacterized protein EHS24_001999 [Apiotrichum porosum]|uniref:Uncharacterized protein n=1 Tax=Apiotrichum porosum TaxID=105984 RepID=A0A427XJR4_9TREE|nr:uncharacterized protein EHS24_001999 [Apiotrichum porosum]RSH79068.1 hypothetical protein EHS24_001999 [Apiotrichum porosum]